MSITKESTVDEICDFLKQNGIKKENIFVNFKKENIKGNEIFFFEKNDFSNLGIKYPEKLIKELDKIKSIRKDVIQFKCGVGGRSTGGDVCVMLFGDSVCDFLII